VVKGFGKDFAAGDGDAACGRLTDAAKRQLTARVKGRFSCSELVERTADTLAAADKKEFANAKVTSEKVSGSSATVMTAGSRTPTRLTKVGGKWLVDVDAPADHARAVASRAKLQARYAVVAFETCYVNSQNYDHCRGDKLTGEEPVSFGSGPGEVEIVRTTRNSYELASHAESGGSRFGIAKDDSGQMKRTCAPAAAPGCNDGAW
jgi:hypothetical protein